MERGPEGEALVVNLERGKKMTKFKVLAFLAVVALALLLPAGVLAQQPPPHRFGGSVTLDGAAAKDGTK